MHCPPNRAEIDDHISQKNSNMKALIAQAVGEVAYPKGPAKVARKGTVGSGDVSWYQHWRERWPIVRTANFVATESDRLRAISIRY